MGHIHQFDELKHGSVSKGSELPDAITSADLLQAQGPGAISIQIPDFADLCTAILEVDDVDDHR